MIAERILFGIGMFGSSLFVLSVAHVPFGVGIAISVIAALLSCRFPVAGSRHVQATGNRQPATPIATLLSIVPLLAITFIAAIVPVHDFDGRAFWLLKAKALAVERTVDGPFFHDDEPRNQYPLLMPLDASAVMIATGGLDDRDARWLYLVTFFALVFVIWHRVGPWYAAILAWLPQFAFDGALSAYSDVAVAAFVACAFFGLFDTDAPLRFGMWLAFLVLTKNEGLPIAFILLVIGAFSFRRRISIAAIPAVIATAALFVWRSGIPKTDEEDYVALLPSFPAHLDRLFPAIGEWTKHLLLLANWGVFWVVALIALAVLAWRREWRPPATVAGVFALYIGAYMVTQWKMEDLAAVTADRLLMHTIGPALYAIAAVIDGSVRNRYSPPERPPRPA